MAASSSVPANGGPELLVVRRALISVSDKTGVVAFARQLAARGAEILSTGGTAVALKAAGIAVTDVSTATGFPEIMDGRVKTLHPTIHGGLLALRDDPAHRAAMDAQGIAPIDLLAVNLYPFEQTVASGAGAAEAIETIDVGGPAMIRAAAKNHAYVAVAVDPEDYAAILAALEAEGGVNRALRRRLAGQAFARTAAYDSAIAGWFAAGADAAPAPRWRSFSGTLGQSLRYGENPHQRAALYRTGEARPGVATARQVQGKELSYNNLNDTDAAYEMVAEFDPARAAAVAIVKHANPCGAAEAESLAEAYRLALRADPLSAFGGIVALNRPLDAETAAEIAKIFTEVIIAPDASDEALAIIAAKKNLRLLLAGALPDPHWPGETVRSIAGGLLVQERDRLGADEATLKIVTRREPSAREIADLRFAWRIVKHVKSNAIVYAKDGATTGIGAGQMSRIDASLSAARKSADAAAAAGLKTPLSEGSVCASDAFFPFADGLQTVAGAGITAIIQPGGAQRDAEVIEAADAAGIAMVFTGTRHFRH